MLSGFLVIQALLVKTFPNNEENLINSDITLEREATQVKKDNTTIPPHCTFCNDTCELSHICKKCGNAAHCNLDCNRSDWYRHKFSCRLGRPIDATDCLVLSCKTNEVDDVIKEYGFMHFVPGNDRWKLFNQYSGLIINWDTEEEELRSAVKKNKLKEMLTTRCLQTRDPAMLRDMQWLKNEEGFGASSEGPGLITLFDAAREELLLDPDDRNVPITELPPPEKKQIRNGIKPNVDEDNWIALDFCIAADHNSEQQLASAYGSLVERCSFDEFWKAMADSSITGLFSKYGPADAILHMRNFKDVMSIVNGEDEMKLHEACISGELASLLESVLGSPARVPRDLLKNPYPLENYPLMGMVTASVIMYRESDLDRVSTSERNANGKKAVILSLPDAEDEAMKEWIQDRAAFLGTGVRQRYHSASDGTVIMEDRVGACL
ncbi:hypothetical protein BGW36DRAFT_363598 [Talaromyces proteolyticus]|uniref:MYND-type domain-containing protein n=1 Tax=Talaromyces proteolyticus TaxID=1131652 RepID=A0AAD4KKC8_9EURO|nr:uncharacterized protein BGW36DRAFT_363598 [Talaromyces proteolyticus]KAH8691261.1 hypothetical protein BGW36DRAFT_363598 [Talaromyces proteolyticus]